jgi:hypothetical protein
MHPMDDKCTACPRLFQQLVHARRHLFDAPDGVQAVVRIP